MADKYRKTVSKDGLTPEQKADFISKLNAYLLGQIKATTNAVVTQYSDLIHEDLANEIKHQIEESSQKLESAFKEDEPDKIERLAKEYEFTLNFDQAEKYYKRLVLRDPQNPAPWLTLSQFYTKRGEFSKATHCFNKVRTLDPSNEEHLLTYIALLITQNRSSEAKQALTTILGQNFKHVHANILMALVQEIENRPGLVRKFMAIAKV